MVARVGQQNKFKLFIVHSLFLVFFILSYIHMIEIGKMNVLKYAGGH